MTAMEVLNTPRAALRAARPPWGSSKVAEPHLLESIPGPLAAPDVRCRNTSRYQNIKDLATLFLVRHAAAPMGPASPIGTRLRGVAQSIWKALERAGQRRAQRELALLSQRHAASDPALAEQLWLAAADLAAGAGRVRSEENP